MTEQARKRKRRLGKGLNSLLTKAVEVSPPKPESAEVVVENKEPNRVDLGRAALGTLSNESPEGLVYVLTEQIVPNPRQPRQVFDEEGLTALAESINTAGLMQPIMVRHSSDPEQFEIIAGERRWRAAQLAGLQQIPAILRELDDKTSAEWALIENLQREDLNPIDRAEAFDRLVVDFGVTHTDIATQLGIDRSSVC